MERLSTSLTMRQRVYAAKRVNDVTQVPAAGGWKGSLGWEDDWGSFSQKDGGGATEWESACVEGKVEIAEADPVSAEGVSEVTSEHLGMDEAIRLEAVTSGLNNAMMTVESAAQTMYDAARGFTSAFDTTVSTVIEEGMSWTLPCCSASLTLLLRCLLSSSSSALTYSRSRSASTRDSHARAALFESKSIVSCVARSEHCCARMHRC